MRAEDTQTEKTNGSRGLTSAGTEASLRREEAAVV